ncbi:expressed unknown protein [Seminavis robusta]|uniref:Uncharacterized protein n=1 Tax=Seminavis robusta TaxID=568900 RepID=A0A9N8E0P7_9STRA|nr:expressed unknown protein [Seminavis robusta]|eukprot:Sro508_g156710.1 n/a (155) ;mRNA; f:23547-24011
MPTLVDTPDVLDAAKDIPISASKSKAGKQRTNAPTGPSDASSFSSQAIAAANLAAAVQMAASLQLKIEWSFVTLDAVFSAWCHSCSSQSDNIAGIVPIGISLLVGMANSHTRTNPTSALKATQDSPPFVHVSKTDSAPQLKSIDQDRLTLKGGM